MTKKLSKIQIATYLKDYSNFIEYACLNPTKNLFEVFKDMLIKNNRGQYAIKEYYFNMISIFEFFLLNKTYSFMADNLFDYILEKNLKDINIPDNIFINKNDKNKFSKKQIIKFIRNAINHNNQDDKELYSLYTENGILKIEIYLKNTKPIPLHIKLNVNEYINIMNGLWNANKIDLIYFNHKDEINIKNNNLNQELDKIFYRRYYYKNKINDNILEKIKKANDNIFIDNKIKQNLCEEDYYYKDYNLSIPQKLKISEDLDFWTNLLPADKEMAVDYVVTKIIPIGINKIPQLRFSLIIANWYARRCTKSLFDVFDDAKKICLQEYDKDNILCDENLLEKDCKIVMRALDYEYLKSIAFSIYASYLFDTLILDEKVKIGNYEYLKEKIRNSFVHGRWFVGTNQCFKLYDCNNSKDNELNYNWRASFPFDTLYNSIDKYYNKLSKNEDNDFLYLGPTIEFDDNDKPIEIILTKEDKTYILNINIDSYSDTYTPWGLYNFYGNKLIYNDNKDDDNIFFNELKNYLLNINPDYIHLFNFIYYQHKICTLYKKKLIPLEELTKNDKYIRKHFTNKHNIDNSNKKIKYN